MKTYTKVSIWQITIIALVATMVAAGCATFRKVPTRTVTISVAPSNATISQDGDVVGVGSISTILTQGYYKTFDLSADGYDSETVKVRYSDNQVSYNYSLKQNRKSIYVSVTPNTTNINYKGSIVGTGNYKFSLGRGRNVDLQLSAPGYLSKTVRINYNDNQSSYNFNLVKDQAYMASVSGADIANKTMRIVVRKEMLRDQALKNLKYYITDNFETLEVNDNMAGWVRTAWTITKFNTITVRTRLEIKEVPDDGSGLSFKFFIASQYTTPKCGTSDECFQDWDRILKKYVKLYADMQNAVF